EGGRYRLRQTLGFRRLDRGRCVPGEAHRPTDCPPRSPDRSGTVLSTNAGAVTIGTPRPPRGPPIPNRDHDHRTRSRPFLLGLSTPALARPDGDGARLPVRPRLPTLRPVHPRAHADGLAGRRRPGHAVPAPMGHGAPGGSCRDGRGAGLARGALVATARHRARLDPWQLRHAVRTADLVRARALVSAPVRDPRALRLYPGHALGPDHGGVACGPVVAPGRCRRVPRHRRGDGSRARAPRVTKPHGETRRRLAAYS